MKLRDRLGNKHNEMLVKSYNKDLSANDYIDSYIDVIETWLKEYSNMGFSNINLINFMISDLR